MSRPVIFMNPFEEAKEIPVPKDLKENVKQNIASVALMFVLAMNYLTGVVEACRGRLWVEVLISLVVPVGLLASAWWLGDRKFYSGRVLQLCFIESIYNVSAIFALASIYMGSATGARLSGYGFFVFYFFQYGGFMVKAITIGRVHGVFQGTCLFLCIMRWFLYEASDASSVLDADLRLLMWGSDASWNVKAMYCIWATNTLLCDSLNIPKLTTVVFHAASITISCLSGEFFHVRLLTACHLFFLDGWFGYAWLGTTSPDFCTIPHAYQAYFFNTVQPNVAKACSVLALAVLVKNFAGY